MGEPEAPDLATRDKLLAVLADLISRGGPAPFLLTPVAPGRTMFPEPWAASKSGLHLVLRRLAMHAGLDRNIVLDDQRHGAPPTERKPATRLELVSLDKTAATFTLGFIGNDNVTGTLAHEIGVAHAILNRPASADPYRSQKADVLEPDITVTSFDGDGVRGSIATVYLGIGVLAANAAYQHYSWAGRFNGAYEPLEVEVLRAGHVPMSALAYLLAVRAVALDEAAPAGLLPPQRDEVSAWIRALRDDRTELRARLGLAETDRAESRTRPEAFADGELELDDHVERKTAFRWRTHRGGVGLIAGTVFGVSIAMMIASRGASPMFAFGGAAGGHLVGRRVRVPRCSGCASVVRAGATQCPQCGAVLRGDISSLSERLDAEERLEAETSENAHVD